MKKWHKHKVLPGVFLRTKKLYLGNLKSRRDWGFAPEYVEMMWLMLQHDKPDDYVVGTGESHLVREFVEAAFKYAGIELGWVGEGAEEKGIVRSVKPAIAVNAGDVLIEIDPRYFRPTIDNNSKNKMAYPLFSLS